MDNRKSARAVLSSEAYERFIYFSEHLGNGIFRSGVTGIEYYLVAPFTIEWTVII